MNVTRLDSSDAVTWIRGNPDVTWGPLRFEPVNGNFAIGAFRYRPERELGYLILRHPVYLRLQGSVTDPNIYTGEEAIRMLHVPLPASLKTEGNAVLVFQSGVQEACIVCESFSFYSLGKE